MTEVTFIFHITTGAHHDIHNASRATSQPYTGVMVTSENDTFEDLFSRYTDDKGRVSIHFTAYWRIIFAGASVPWSGPVTRGPFHLVARIGHWSTQNPLLSNPLVVLPRVKWAEKKSSTVVPRHTFGINEDALIPVSERPVGGDITSWFK